MSYVLRTLVLFIALSLPFGAFAASLSVKNIDNEEILVRYEGLSAGQLEIRNSQGRLIKEATAPQGTGRKTISLPDGIQNGTYSVVALDRAQHEVARTSFTVVYDAPTCHASMQKTAKKGDFVTLRWKSEDADSVYVFGKSARASGSERIALYQTGTRGFSVNVFGKGGAGSCSTAVKVSE